MEPITHPPRPRHRRALIAAAVLAALGVTAWFAIARWRAPTPTTYTTAPAERGDVVQAVTASGTLSPVLQVQVGSQVSGRVAEVLVDYNDQVTQGQVLARIDPQLLDAALNQA